MTERGKVCMSVCEWERKCAMPFKYRILRINDIGEGAALYNEQIWKDNDFAIFCLRI